MADGAQFALIMWDELLGQLLSIQSNTSEDNDSNGNIWEDDRYKNKVRQYKNTLPGLIIGPGPLLLAVIGYDREHRPVAETLLV